MVNLDKIENIAKFFLSEKGKETILNFSQGTVRVL